MTQLGHSLARAARTTAGARIGRNGGFYEHVERQRPGKLFGSRPACNNFAVDRHGPRPARWCFALGLVIPRLSINSMQSHRSALVHRRADVDPCTVAPSPGGWRPEPGPWSPGARRTAYCRPQRTECCVTEFRPEATGHGQDEEFERGTNPHCVEPRRMSSWPNMAPMASDHEACERANVRSSSTSMAPTPAGTRSFVATRRTIVGCLPRLPR